MRFFFLLLLCFLTGCTASGFEDSTIPTVPETTVCTTEQTHAEVTLPPETLPPETEPYDPIKEIIGDMSLQERVGQLFLARCDDSVALADIAQYHLGGLLLFGRDFEGQTPESLTAKLASYQAAAKLPLLIAVDEEGGSVTRVSSNPAFRQNRFSSPRSAYTQGGMDAVLIQEEEKCALLTKLGINVNLAPVCDISTDPNAFMYDRSLGQDASVTSHFAESTVRLMSGYMLGSCLKHFPGYGNNADTHTGIAIDSRSLTELENNDLLPFTAGIEAGCDAILVSHTIVEAIDSQTPASLSPVIHAYLRSTMGFEGVILTDDLVMQAITDRYGAEEAAVLAILAGNDLLCSTDYRTQYEAVYAAVLEGRIDIDTLNNAVRNVLEWKTKLGLI
ncbi:MAG: beta-hexosaminidase [Ruminococcus sp.]|nr:beta-hexosaminidase [Ruminococcus sp.]